MQAVAITGWFQQHCSLVALATGTALQTMAVTVMAALQTQAGLPLVTLDRQATKQVHVFGNTWALQGNDYRAVAFKPAKATLEGLRSILPLWLADNLWSLLAVVVVITSVLVYKVARQ